jgi:hypothetical protein
MVMEILDWVMSFEFWWQWVLLILVITVALMLFMTPIALYDNKVRLQREEEIKKQEQERMEYFINLKRTDPERYQVEMELHQANAVTKAGNKVANAMHRQAAQTAQVASAIQQQTHSDFINHR